MKPLLKWCAAVAVILVMALQTTIASQLIMFDDEYCTWCRKWDDEIGVIYNLTLESCHAPLKKIPLGEDLPDTVSLKESVTFTPTFVLLHEQVEVGRIVGYPGEDFFWSMLNDIIKENFPQEMRKSNLANCPNA